MPQTFECKLQTYWDDADPAGFVYFAHFFRFAEYAEAELFRSSGIERMALYEQHSVWMPRVESFAKFSKPIRAEEAIYVRLQTQLMGEKTVRLDFAILSIPERSLLAEGYITAVCIDRSTSRSRPIPAPMRKIFSRASGPGAASLPADD
ncbi:MAG TPA: thioesterase family protein [Blastocatellia bacterium]|nr:thioesterase family protein [Blastocatellia bacterium]